jgi:hypothetical protein
VVHLRKEHTRYELPELLISTKILPILHRFNIDLCHSIDIDNGHVKFSGHCLELRRNVDLVELCQIVVPEGHFYSALHLCVDFQWNMFKQMKCVRREDIWDRIPAVSRNLLVEDGVIHRAGTVNLKSLGAGMA